MQHWRYGRNEPHPNLAYFCSTHLACTVSETVFGHMSLSGGFVLTSRSKLAYTRQSLRGHLVVQKHSLDDWYSNRIIWRGSKETSKFQPVASQIYLPSHFGSVCGFEKWLAALGPYLLLAWSVLAIEDHPRSRYLRPPLRVCKEDLLDKPSIVSHSPESNPRVIVCFQRSSALRD